MGFNPGGGSGQQGAISSAYDSALSNVTGSDTLIYDASTGKWRNKPGVILDTAGNMIIPTGGGIIIKDSSNNSWKMTVNTSGALSLNSVGGSSIPVVSPGAVTVNASGNTVSVSGSITTTSSVTLDGLNISIAQDTTGYPWVKSVAITNGVTVNGTRNLSGSTALTAGNYVAYVSYSVDNQATWITGAKSSFTITNVNTGGGNTGNNGLGNIVSGIYVNKWNAPNLATVLSKPYNLAYAFVAWSAQANTGLLEYTPFEGDASFRAAKQASGKKVILSVGGGGNSSLYVTNATQVTQFVNSAKAIIDRLDLDGIDWDIESNNITAASMYSASQQLVDHYGSDFIIHFVPRPYETIPFEAAQLCHQAGILTLFGMQFYDASEFSSYSSGWPYINNYINRAINTYGIPASKILIGVTSANYSGRGGMSYALMKQYWDSVKAQHPTIRGMFIYDAPIEQNANWGFASNIIPYINQ